ncbi:MAG: class A beta-lactamase-related serine hydrolase [Acidobacteriota bacterium]|nr:class A beta-lactamase-related serine hydrolase [Acidobacteriota bacterium]
MRARPLDTALITHRIDEIAAASESTSIAVSLYDYEHALSWSYQGDRWSHAASTIKVAVLYALYAAIDERRFGPHRRLHVRNRFASAVDGTPFRVSPVRDGNMAVHAALGKTMRLSELATHMITTSSNLATNLLLDLVGVEYAREMLARASIGGVDLVRGVEDDAAFEAGVNNRVTANGLVRLFRAIHESWGVSKLATADMLEILHMQQFQSGIPAGLPADARARARVANKTGEISTAAHDTGIVFVAGRQPYALTVLTEHAPDSGKRMDAVARVSTAVYQWLVAADPPAPEQCV